MAVSAIEIVPDFLDEVLPLFKLVGVKVIGSENAEKTVILRVEGPTIPDVPRCDCLLSRTVEIDGMSFRATFRPVTHG